MRDHAAEASAQLVEHIDADGRVLEVVTRAEMRAGRLRHRSTYVAIVDSGKRLVVHRRAEWKDVHPGWWDLAFGGVCDVGEGWEDAARRELAEEAGVIVEGLDELGSFSYEADGGSLIGRCYLAECDDELTCPDGEVAEVDRVALSEVEVWMTNRRVCPDALEGIWPMLRARYGL